MTATRISTSAVRRSTPSRKSPPTSTRTTATGPSPTWQIREAPPLGSPPSYLWVLRHRWWFWVTQRAASCGATTTVTATWTCSRRTRPISTRGRRSSWGRGPTFCTRTPTLLPGYSPTRKPTRAWPMTGSLWGPPGQTTTTTATWTWQSRTTLGLNAMKRRRSTGSTRPAPSTEITVMARSRTSLLSSTYCRTRSHRRRNGTSRP